MIWLLLLLLWAAPVEAAEMAEIRLRLPKATLQWAMQEVCGHEWVVRAVAPGFRCLEGVPPGDPSNITHFVHETINALARLSERVSLGLRQVQFEDLQAQVEVTYGD